MNLSVNLPDRTKISAWLKAHRPLAWVESLTPDYGTWQPDPPVIERLIR